MNNNPNKDNRQDEEKENRKGLFFLFDFFKNPKNLPLIASLLGGAAVVTTSAILLAPSSSSSSEPSSVATSAIPSSTVSSTVSSGTVSSSEVVSSSELSSETIGPWTVTFDAQGGEAVDAQTVEHNGLLTEPDTFYGLMLLSGWYTSSDEGVTLNTRWEFDEDVVTEDLTLYAFWTTPLITDYDRMFVTSSHVAVLDDNDIPYTWGENFTGTLGIGTKNDMTSPVRVDMNNFEENETIVHVSGSNTHTVYLTNLDNVYAAGLNESYAFGLDATTVSEYLIPTKLPLNLPEGETVLNVWASRHTTWILTDSGRLFVAGNNVDDLLGVEGADANFYIETFQEVTFPSFSDDEFVVDAFFGVQQYFALSNLGNVYAWGLDDGTGVLGIEEDYFRTGTPTRLTFEGLAPREYIVDLSVYEKTTLALTNQNRLYGWGEGDNGQLMIAEGSEVYPQPILLDTSFLEAGETITSISSGRRHGTVLTSLGNLYTFGDNGDGQLGINDGVDRAEPVLLTTGLYDEGEQPLYIASGNDWTFVVTNYGRWFGVGDNSNKTISYQDIPNFFELTLIQILD